MVSNKEIKYVQNLINNSLKLKAGEKIWIECTDVPEDFVCQVLKQVRKVGGLPFVNYSTQRLNRQMLEVCDNIEYLQMRKKFDLAKMQEMDCYLSIACPQNTHNLHTLDSTKLQNYNSIYQNAVHFDERVNNTRWTICNYPSQSLANRAGMNYDEYCDYLLDVCCIEYTKMHELLMPLKILMEKTDKVKILGKGTDLTFSIRDMPAIICAGDSNIPDGEIYTAPIVDTIDGVISFNAPSNFEGKEFKDIRLEFEKGRVVKATSSDIDNLERILNTDLGARSVGEFALGVNTVITKPVGDILFDEKISGSLHLALGNSYNNADNGNRSAIHWDLVLIQTPNFGGGEIWFDDILIRKNGRFVLEELKSIDRLK